MRARVLVASVAVHGVLAALLVSLAAHPFAPPREPVTIEMLPTAPVVEPVPIEPSPGVEPARQVKSRPAATTRVAHRAVSGSRGSSAPEFDVDPRGAIHYETGPGDGIGTGTGDGAGTGDGSGSGIAERGFASSAAATAPIVSVPDAPKASKARRAVLIYPKKHGSDDDPSIFVAQVTIDDEGYVVGAHVLHGEGGPRGQQASDLIWRFRYDPARDDDGRPIRSTIEQPFLVGR